MYELKQQMTAPISTQIINWEGMNSQPIGFPTSSYPSAKGGVIPNVFDTPKTSV